MSEVSRLVALEATARIQVQEVLARCDAALACGEVAQLRTLASVAEECVETHRRIYESLLEARRQLLRGGAP